MWEGPWGHSLPPPTVIHKGHSTRSEVWLVVCNCFDSVWGCWLVYFDLHPHCVDTWHADWEEIEEKTSSLKMSVWAGALGSNWAKLTGLIFDESEKLTMPVIGVFVCNFLNGWSGHESISIEEMLWLTCRRELVEVFETNHTGDGCWLKVVESVGWIWVSIDLFGWYRWWCCDSWVSFLLAVEVFHCLLVVEVVCHGSGDFVGGLVLFADLSSRLMRSEIVSKTLNEPVLLVLCCLWGNVAFGVVDAGFFGVLIGSSW